MLPEPVAIVDIGSNSVRLVVYSGPARVPAILFNEKVLAGLGKGMEEGGALSEKAQARALAALRRFHLLIGQMRVGKVRVVATAAVRDASNGSLFLKRVREIGFKPEVIAGEEEGRLAGYGVLSGIPQADGLVGDLGGGSLELVDVGEGAVRASASLPLGTLRLAPLLAKGEGALVRRVRKALDGGAWAPLGRKRPFYLVGGSWRALARLDMLLTQAPLPITHEYQTSPGRPAELRHAIAADPTIAEVAKGRAQSLRPADLLLQTLIEELKPSALIVSSYGIREGLLYRDLSDAVRARDPLIEATRAAGKSLGRFDEHGALIDRWIAPVFDDAPEQERLRRAACFLADVAWAAHPDFRAERGMDLALHGNWVGVDGPGRVMIAAALFTSFGGGKGFGGLEVARLVGPEKLARAQQWGLAMRLAQRFSGGVAAALERSNLAIDGKLLRLTLAQRDEALFGEAVERRLFTLAAALGVGAEAVVA